MADTKTFTLVSLNPSEDYYWEVHKLNCRDALKYKRTHGSTLVNNIKADSPEALIAAELKDDLEDMGYSADDFRIMPCCKEAH